MLKCQLCESTALDILSETDDNGQIYRCSKCGNKIHPYTEFPSLIQNGPEPFIRLFHVGGRQNYIGPAQNLLRMFGEAMELIVCEADPDVGNAGLKEEYDANLRTKVITLPYCIYSSLGYHDFYINADPDSSSLLKTALEAASYFNRKVTWGEVTKAVKMVQLKTETIDHLIGTGKIKVPHFVSIDAQGAEWDILTRSSQTIGYEAVGVVTEVEFNRLYEDQSLFEDTTKMLRYHNFRLFRLYNEETWYHTKDFARGDGMLTVAEALYLRDYRYYFRPTPDFWPLARLCAAAVAFNQWSYAYTIIEKVSENYKDAWEKFVKSNGLWFCEKATLEKFAG